MLITATTPEEKLTLPWVDFSMLTAINTCPRWGMIHSWHGKRFATYGRSMALEAGSAMHDMFAAVRMFELMEHVKVFAKDGFIVVPDYIFDHGAHLFNSKLFPDRWNEACHIFDQPDDYDTRMMRFALYILETTGFHDDPSDRKRTQTNLETAAIA